MVLPVEIVTLDPFKKGFSPASCGGRTSSLILPRQDPSGKRAVIDDSDPLIQTERNDLSFGLTVEEVVTWLRDSIVFKPVLITCPKGLAVKPSGEIRATEVTNLSRRDQIR